MDEKKMDELNHKEIGGYSMRSDHLLLLVGGNPLPDAVAGSLLATQEGIIALIHSKELFRISQRLGAWFHQKGFKKVKYQEVRESDPVSIVYGVRQALLDIKEDPVKIGLNYTGGTKAMAVHAYRVVEQWSDEQRGKGRKVETVFSYLDARTLEMVFDPVDLASGGQVHPKYVGLSVELNLNDLLQLHGWTLQHPPATQPILPKSAQSLANVHTKQEAAEAWHRWLQANLFKYATHSRSIDVNCSRSPDGQKCTVELPTIPSNSRRKWLSQGKLKNIEIQWPTDSHLIDITETMKTELNQDKQLNLSNAAQVCGYKETKDFCKWLNGGWLESVVLEALRDCASNCFLHDVSMNLLPASSEENPTRFEFDVVAVRGYQLFAFSCTTDTEKVQGGRDRMKKKLFEAYIRAHQLGGDEACVALVCCSDAPDTLEHEIRRDVEHKSRIRVFGRMHLANLSAYLKEWIQSQSGEK